MSVAIIGAPNVGKSTLLNALLGEQRAIVSDIQGTTRDTIEDTLVLDGILFRLIDTAGIRETADSIEQMGVERSRQAAAKAQIVISVLERGVPEVILDNTAGKTVIKVYNKSDLLMPDERVNIIDGICISAKKGVIASLQRALVCAAKEGMETSAVMLSNARHYEAVSRAHEAIERVQQGLQSI